ncbi:MAG: hypothetical protein EBT92_13730 [Planctomycetes bacterium]|nr:hypothetical protein [Planctomycetota bacterium]
MLLQKKENQSLIKMQVFERPFFYLVLVVIIFVPIINHGCHANPHTDDELCLYVYEINNGKESVKKTRPVKSGFNLNK